MSKILFSESRTCQRYENCPLLLDRFFIIFLFFPLSFLTITTNHHEPARRNLRIQVSYRFTSNKSPVTTSLFSPAQHHGGTCPRAEPLLHLEFFRTLVVLKQPLRNSTRDLRKKFPCQHQPEFARLHCLGGNKSCRKFFIFPKTTTALLR